MEIGNNVPESTPRISQISRLRAASGDGTISPETAEAIRNGAVPPQISPNEENNNVATENAAPTSERTSLREIVASAESNAAIETPQDVVDLSPEALVAASDAPESTVTSQNLAETSNDDAATVALGNTVDVNS